MKRDWHSARVTVVIAWVLATSLVGCSPRQRLALWALNSPEYHVQNGWHMLERGQVGLAVREFEMARAYDPQYAPCYVGLGVAYAEKGEYAHAFDFLTQAKANVKQSGQLLQARVGAIRILTKAHAAGHAPPAWLDLVEQEFTAAEQSHPKNPALYYFLALAYKSGERFHKAVEAFEKVLELNAAYVPEAKTELAALTARTKVSP